MQFRILIINNKGRGWGNRIKIELLQSIYKRYFIFFLACSAVLLLLFILLQLLSQITLTITMHVGFIPVFTQYTRDVCLIYLILHHNHYLAEVLQQQAQEYRYDEEIPHNAKIWQHPTIFK